VEGKAKKEEKSCAVLFLKSKSIQEKTKERGQRKFNNGESARSGRVEKKLLRDKGGGSR